MKYICTQKIHMKKIYQFLINKRESTGLKHFNDPKALLHTHMISKMFIKILKNIVQVKKHKILIGFDNIFADMINNKKIQL